MPTDKVAAMFFPSVYCIVFLGKISLDSATIRNLRVALIISLQACPASLPISTRK